MFRFGFGALALVSVAACTTDAREETSPTEACELLVSECAGLDDTALDDCADIGRRGLADPKHEDQCYVFFDSCFDECQFVRLWRYDSEPDASTSSLPDAAAPMDAAASSLTAAPTDAATPTLPDAAAR